MRALLVLAWMLGASEAMALSCLPPDVARTYRDAARAEEAYIIVHGALAFDEKRLPLPDPETQKVAEVTRIPARLSGSFLSLNGFDSSFSQSITLEAVCLGPWCPSPKSGVQVLAFLRRDGEGYALEVNACGGFAVFAPTSAALDQAVACIQGKSCAPRP